MKKILLCTTVLAGFASSALAGGVATDTDMQVSVAGSSKFEGGYVNRNSDYKKRFTFSPNQSTTAFLTSNKVAVKAQGTTDDITYGAVVRIQTVANASNGMSDTGMDRSMVYVNTNAGAVQLGTNFAASKLLAVDAGTIASATGGVAGGDAWAFIDFPKNTMFNSVVATDTDTLSNRLDVQGESYRKITYLSPEISGAQLALSYAPDVQNNGAKDFTTEYSARYLTRPVAVKNLVSAGLKFKHTVGEVNLTHSLTGDMGKADNSPYQPKGQNITLVDTNGVSTDYTLTDRVNTTNVNRNDLKTFAIGTVAEYQGFSAALSYSKDGKSLAPKSSNFTSSWYTAGIAYKNGPMSTSLTYLNARKGNKSYADNDSNNSYPTVSTKALSLGVDYAVAPGLTPFAEVTGTQVKPKRVINGNTKQKATVFILGTRIKF